MSERDPMIHIRITPELKEALQASAKKNGRTMNADVVARLVTSLNQDALPKRSDIFWVQDGKLMRNPLLPHAERISNARQRLEIIMKEWTALSDGLGGLPDVMKGTIIRRLNELEEERSNLDTELRLIDPDYRDNH